MPIYPAGHTFTDTPQRVLKSDAGTESSRGDYTSYRTICLVAVAVLAMAIISVLSFMLIIVRGIATMLAEMFPPVVIRVPPLRH